MVIKLIDKSLKFKVDGKRIDASYIDQKVINTYMELSKMLGADNIVNEYIDYLMYMGNSDNISDCTCRLKVTVVKDKYVDAKIETKVLVDGLDYSRLLDRRIYL